MVASWQNTFFKSKAQ